MRVLSINIFEVQRNSDKQYEKKGVKSDDKAIN